MLAESQMIYILFNTVTLRSLIKIPAFSSPDDMINIRVAIIELNGGSRLHVLAFNQLYYTLVCDVDSTAVELIYGQISRQLLIPKHTWECNHITGQLGPSGINGQLLFIDCVKLRVPPIHAFVAMLPCVRQQKTSGLHPTQDSNAEVWQCREALFLALVGTLH
jgi:hypothetical protein